MIFLLKFESIIFNECFDFYTLLKFATHVRLKYINSNHDIYGPGIFY